jgi:hypothetical protein
MSRFPTGIAVTSTRAGSDAIAFAGNGSPKAVHFSTCIPPRWSSAMRFMLARENKGGSIDNRIPLVF